MCSLLCFWILLCTGVSIVVRDCVLVVVSVRARWLLQCPMHWSSDAPCSLTLGATPLISPGIAGAKMKVLPHQICLPKYYASIQLHKHQISCVQFATIFLRITTSRIHGLDCTSSIPLAGVLVILTIHINRGGSVKEV